MNIIIAGDGEVGFHLAKALTALDHNITVVDPHSELLKRLESETDLLTITGDSTSPRVLAEANVSECDLFISVLHDENINLITCILSSKMGAKRTVCRVSNAELLSSQYREVFGELGINEIVCPEHIAAREINNLLNVSVATEFFDFSGGLLCMYVIRLESESMLVGLRRGYYGEYEEGTLSSIDTVAAIRVVAVQRNGRTFIPHADFIFKQGDLVHMIAKGSQADSIKEIAGKKEVHIKNVAIVGGGRIGRFATKLLQERMNVSIVDMDRSRCEELATELNGGVVVLNGDATDNDFLASEQLFNTDAFVSVTDSSETNVLTCLNAKKMGVGRTIALVENIGFINLSQEIGIDTIINKKLITASYIARFIVKGNAERSKWLSGTNAEVIELIVGKSSPATKKTIGNLGFPEGAVIGGVIRGRETILPTRDTQLQEMDKVVVFALPQSLAAAAKKLE